MKILMMFSILTALTAGALADSKSPGIDLKKIEGELSKTGKKLETAVRSTVTEAEKAAKTADAKVQQTSLYQDMVNTTQKMWKSFKEGLDNAFSSKPSTRRD